MKLSLKFKIALLSFGLSGAMLTVFGMVLFAFVYSTSIDRMDREIRALVEEPLHSSGSRTSWERFGESLGVVMGEARTNHLALLVLSPDKQVLYRTTNAPPQLYALPLPPLPKTTAVKSTSRKERRDWPDDPGPRSQDDFFFFSPDMGPGGPPPNDDGFGPRPPSREILPSVTSFMTMETSRARWRVGIIRNAKTTVFVAMDMDSFYAQINRFRNMFVMSVALGLLLLGIAGWFLASRALKPISVITDTAEGITARGLDRRIPSVSRDSELARLVNVINRMLDRLEKSYHQAVRFSADAAHELQTPLTILQGELDNAIQSSEAGSEEQQRYSMLLDELRNLKVVVQKLLLLAHADEGRLNIKPVSVNLSSLIMEASEDIEMMAPELNIRLQVTDGIHVMADPALLNQTLRNMISNAAKYAKEDGQVVFVLKEQDAAIQFTLLNTAPPIPEEDRGMLFERFHRVEKSRTAAGSGLGLSLAREIARAHGGDLVLDPYTEGMVSFTLTLPLPVK